jgi:hypothetical protein
LDILNILGPVNNTQMRFEPANSLLDNPIQATGLDGKAIQSQMTIVAGLVKQTGAPILSANL